MLRALVRKSYWILWLLQVGPGGSLKDIKEVIIFLPSSAPAQTPAKLGWDMDGGLVVVGVWVVSYRVYLGLTMIQNIEANKFSLWVRQYLGKSLCAWLYPRAQSVRVAIATRTTHCFWFIFLCVWLSHAHVRVTKSRARILYTKTLPGILWGWDLVCWLNSQI